MNTFVSSSRSLRVSTGSLRFWMPTAFTPFLSPSTYHSSAWSPTSDCDTRTFSAFAGLTLLTVVPLSATRSASQISLAAASSDGPTRSTSGLISPGSPP